MLKKNVQHLAALGGPPAFASPLHVGTPNIGDRQRFLQRVNESLDRRVLSNDGPFVRELEARIANLAGVRHCVAVCNATVALEIAARSLGLTGEVIVPSFTFVATAHALHWQNITPVFADIAEDTHCLDPVAVERLITPRTSGIIGVHLWGRVCDVDGLSEVARRHRLKLIFDAAHALGCGAPGRRVGGFGNAEVFSFHATKFVNSFEGGAVVTNDGNLAATMRLMRNFGFAGYDRVVQLGTNGKMSEISAAMGLTSLEAMDAFMAVNRSNFQHYQNCLADIPGIRLISYPLDRHCNRQYVVAEVDAEVAGIGRDEIIRALWQENIFARRYFYPGCHRMEPYRSEQPHAGQLLPVTQKVASRVLHLPTGTAVGQPEIEVIGDVLRLIVDHGPAISRLLPPSNDNLPLNPTDTNRRSANAA